MRSAPMMHLSVAMLTVVFVSPAQAELRGPYAPDANTVALYHFDESPGDADPGNPFENFGSGGSALNLTNTGGPDGRDNSAANGGGYQAPTVRADFGHAVDVLLSGSGSYHSGTTGSPVGGGTTTAGSVAQTALQGADGAFTYEALAVFHSATSEQTVISHDASGTSRGFMLRVLSGNLNFYTGSTSHTASIPTTGPHAFAANEWFHVAVTYNGEQGTEGNLKLYWTRIAAAGATANLLGSAQLVADLANATNPLGVGTTTRSPYRFEPVRIDEVRISAVARAADAMQFTVPPTVISLW